MMDLGDEPPRCFYLDTLRLAFRAMRHSQLSWRGARCRCWTYALLLLAPAPNQGTRFSLWGGSNCLKMAEEPGEETVTPPSSFLQKHVTVGPSGEGQL